MLSPIENLIIKAATKNNLTLDSFKSLQRRFCKIYKTKFDSSDQLIKTYHKLISNKTIKPQSFLERILTLKTTRSDSGIVVVSVLTKPYPCPGKCIYCPSEAGVPKSYLSSEPAVKRAIMCDYHPYTQMKVRLESLESIGHSTEKINIRIIGGTWSFYPKRYQNWFIRNLFKAANGFSRKLKVESGKLEQLQKINETARHRIVEISVETRQDYIDLEEILHLRKLGVTKVELGVQTIYDPILKYIKRGNCNADTIQATKILKDAGFKVSYQMMLNLPQSTPQKDIAMFKKIFANQNYQPDHLKIYPLALVSESELMKFYQKGKFTPYDKDTLIETIAQIKKSIPYYCRIERVMRDIPSYKIIVGGAKISNLRQMIQERLKKEGLSCRCIRCREVRNNFDKKEKYYLYREDFEASSGQEIFLSLENKNRSKLYSVLRLRVPKSALKYEKSLISVLTDAAIIREVHTYGPVLGIGEKSTNATQHRGFGKKLITVAENIAKNEFGLSKIAVIAGVGVRGYFRKLGYNLRSTYMLKKLR